MYTSLMPTQFFRGALRLPSGPVAQASWAVTQFGIFACFQGDNPQVEIVTDVQVERSDLVTEVDLGDLDRASIEALVTEILTGGYLDKPGVKGKGDAVLFVLVNEALRELEKIRRFLESL
jgi:hypothetical protein